MRELCPENEPSWYALHVRYQHEIRMGQLLESWGWETLVPAYRQSRQWSDRVKEIEGAFICGLCVLSVPEKRVQACRRYTGGCENDPIQRRPCSGSIARN